MLHITCHQGNANSNSTETPRRPDENGPGPEPRQQQMQARVWSLREPTDGCWDPSGAATVEAKWLLTKPGDPAMCSLVLNPKELKTSVHTKAYSWVFVAPLFIIAKVWKQPTCSLIGEYIRKP